MAIELTLRCLNDGKNYTLSEGCSVYDACIAIKPTLKHTAVCAKVNNVAHGLDFRIYENSDVEFLDISSKAGMTAYTHTLLFVVAKAVEDLYHGVQISVEAPVSNGYYIDLRHAEGIELDINALRNRIDQIVAANKAFERIVSPTEDAVAVFERAGMKSKATLLKSVGSLYTTYYTLDGYPGYFFSDMCPSTGYITLYGIEKFHNGLLLRLPDPQNEGRLKPFVKQEKMLEVFEEHHRWQDLGGLRTVGDLNQICAQGHAVDVINISEALQEKKICHIAEDINSRGSVRLVLIAGPSSSGKTTFSKRLGIQLMTCGWYPHAISMDDYFLPRAETPLDADGNYDYESIDALNLPLLADHLAKLFSGEEVELPRYDFITGESVPSGKRLRLRPNDILVMEGIHALNPRLTESIASQLKYKVYISALTTIQLDDQNYIPTTDNRLLRRIVRDYKYRGYSAQDTIGRWPSVTAGEKKWIFPFQEESDAIFNSALLFELAVLRTQALPLLNMVPESAPEYAEAQRLSKFLSYINPINIGELPPVSLLREFMGGSSFIY